jgi:pentapeptide repeat protein
MASRTDGHIVVLLINRETVRLDGGHGARAVGQGHRAAYLRRDRSPLLACGCPDGADLRKAECRGSGASLKNAELGRADLSSARFVDTDLSGAKLRAADLSEAVLVRTKVEGADFGYSTVFGSSVWLRSTSHWF